MTLREFCDRFDADVEAVKIGKRYFHDPHGLYRKWHGAFSVGIFLGEERGTFRPTPALLDLLEYDRKVIVDDKAAWMFLCGKDILMEGVLEPCGKGPALVTDEDDNVLGYGEVINDFDERQEHRVFLKNRLDRGEYLRRER